MSALGQKQTSTAMSLRTSALGHKRTFVALISLARRRATFRLSLALRFDEISESLDSRKMGAQWPASAKVWKSGASSILLVCLVMPAFAEDKLAWSATLTGTTDYVFRGFSLSNQNPALQGSLDATYGIFYAGVWSSNVEDEGYEPVEVDRLHRHQA